MFFVLSNFTRSSIAPTLFGRKTENCFTSGPSIFEVVCGKSTAIWVARRRENRRRALTTISLPIFRWQTQYIERCRAPRGPLANPRDLSNGYIVTSDSRFQQAKPNSSLRLFIFGGIDSVPE